MVLPKNFFEAVSFPEVLYHQNILLISSDDLYNSNFIINYMIVGLTKDYNFSKNNQIFACLVTGNLENYHNYQMKCGTNFRHMYNTKSFGIYDFNDELEDFVCFVEDEKTKKKRLDFDFEIFKVRLMERLDEYFADDFEGMRVVIIDDVTSFVGLGASLSQVILFINYLKLYCTKKRISMVIQTYRPKEDFTTLSTIEQLDINLRKLAKSIIVCNKLEAGVSPKCDGTIVTKNFFNNSQQEFIFKTLERSVKISNIGAFT